MASSSAIRIGFIVALLCAATAFAQVTTFTWSNASSGAWFTSGNWSTIGVPNSIISNRASVASNVTVTASGGSSLSLQGLDLSSSGAKVVFDFSSSSLGLTLGTGSSIWSAGSVEFKTAAGLAGNGSANTSVSISSGAQLLFSTLTGTRGLSSLTLNNSGTLQATSGIVSIGSAIINNQAGGLIHANGAEFAFQSGTTLNNSGTLRATGSSGVLRFNGTVTTANLGSVDLVSGAHAYIGGTINNASATLAAPGAGSFELLGGTITGGTIGSGAVTFTTSGGYLDATTLTGNLTLPASTYVRFTNGANFSGSTATFNPSASLYWSQAATLAGKALTFGNGSYIYVYGGNSTLTLDSASTGNGQIQIYSDGSNGTAITNQGSLTHTANTGYLYARSFTNSGSISATGGSLVIGSTSTSYNTSNTGNITVDGSGTIVYLDGNVANTGALKAQNSGELRFRGTNTTANLGNITIGSGGHVYLNGTLDNTGATLTAPNGGVYELLGGTIIGGTISASTVSPTSSGGTVNGVTLLGDLNVPTSTGFYATGGSTFTGANASFANNSWLYWQQAGTLSGKSLTFGNGSYIYVNGGNSALTLDATTTATGQIQIYSDGSNGTTITNQGNLTHSVSSGYLYARTFTNSGNIKATSGSLVIGSTSTSYNTTNSGNIGVDGNGTIVYLDGNVANTGLIGAKNSGEIRFRGTNTTGNLGNITIASGGIVSLAGTLDNTGATLTAPTGGTFQLLGGTINNGTIGAGALTFTNYSGTLGNVTWSGDFALPASTSVYWTGGTTFTGGNATLGSNSSIYWQQNGTLNGKALTFGSGSYLYLNTGNTTLSLGNATTATGQVQIYGYYGNTTIANQGSITNTTGTGYLFAPSLVNSGTITATSGNLQIGYGSSGYNTTNTGSIIADGNSTIVFLDGNVANTGTLKAQNSGELRFRGDNTTANLGNITLTTGGTVNLNGTLDNTGATLTAPNGGTFQLLGGTINNGTIAAGALTFTNYSGTLGNVTWSGDFALPASTSVYWTGGTTFTGGNATLGSNSSIYWQQNGALNGKALTFGNGSYLYLNTGNTTLSLGNTTTATGQVQIYGYYGNSTIANQGSITNTTGAGYLFAPSLANSGTIVATGGNLQIGYGSSGYNTTNTGNITVDGNSTIVYLDGNVANTGTITAQNSGELRFRGTNTTANLGTIKLATGGHAYLNGTLDNSLATLTAPIGGIFELLGGTINNGTISAGALTLTNYGGTLNNVTWSGDLNAPANTSVIFAGGTSFTGGNATLGNNSTIYWQQSGTLAGEALTFGSGSSLYLYGGNTSITLGNTTTATGQIQIYGYYTNSIVTNQGNLTHTSGNGNLFAPTLTNAGNITATGGALEIGYNSTGYTTSNIGNIVADGTGTIVYLDGDLTNTGTLIARNSGELRFRGSTTTGKIGAVSLSTGGHAYLNGTLDNTSTTLNAPTGGSFELLGGTIKNGTVASNALTFTNYAGTLDNVTLLGSVAFPANAYAYFTGSTNFAAGAALSLGSNASIYWQQTGTLNGNAVTFGSGAYIYLSGTNAAVTLDPTSTASGDVRISADGSTGTAVTNQGTITHASGTGYLDAETVANAGTITATGGTLYLGRTNTGSSVTNAVGATLRVNGGSIVVQPPAATPLVNNGTIDIQSGTFYTNNRVTNGTSGVVKGAGVINGNMILSGGTLAPGNSGIGTLTFNFGTLTVAGAATFAVDLGGTTSDQLVFQNPPSAVNIGSGLLTLSLNLLSAPTANTTFNLISISSGSNTISGSFAGLLNTGDTTTALFGGTPYTFSVKYQTNLVSLTYTPVVVPEPSVYALLGLGLAIVGYSYRRRRR